MNTLNNIKKYKKYQVDGFSRLQKEQQLLYRFENNYGASVIYHYGSYGYNQGLFELAVIKWHETEWGLCYETEITDDVLGYLAIGQVENLLERIKNLKEEVR